MTLTPEQMEEAVDAMFRAHNSFANPSPTQRHYFRTILTAALPVIERAILGRAAKLHDDRAGVLNSKRPLTNGENARMGWHWRQAAAIRAIVSEE